MKRTMVILVGLMLLSASVAESACKFNAKREQNYRVRVAQFLAAKAKQTTTNVPAAQHPSVPMAKAN